MSNEAVFSFLKGYSFSFKVDEHDIDVWFSSLSGLEKVYVDNELVAKQRNFSRKSTQSFTINGVEYTTELSAESITQGPFVYLI